MKLHLSKELRAGLIVLLIAVSMYWLVYFLKGHDIFSRFTYYTIEYESVEGINVTGPVFIRGLKVGTIKNISYNHQKDNFDVTIQLESRYQIPQNSIAQIYSMDLLGTKAIRILMGDSKKVLANNDLIQSDIAADLVSSIAKELPSLKEQIAGLISNLDSSAKNLNSILGAQNQSNLENILVHLTETLRYFRSLGAWLNEETPQIHAILDNLGQLSIALGASSADIQKTMSNLAGLSDTLRQSNITEAIRDLDLLLIQLRDPNGSLGKLLYSDEIHQNISRLLQSLDTLVFNIGQNPKRFFKISVF